MKITRLLTEKEHRPWELPSKPWQYYQEWNQAIFLHWEVDPDTLRKWVPETLELDLIDGKAWISIVAFTMDKVRPRNLPAFSPVSTFDELNVRTYVRRNGKAGVHFIHIQAGNKLSTFLARILSGLPYRYASMERKKNDFTATNERRKNKFHVEYTIEHVNASKSTLDKWLTERYAVFQGARRKVLTYNVHHVEWPLNNVTIDKLTVEYRAIRDLFDRPPDLAHYSPGVQVLTWGRNK